MCPKHSKKRIYIKYLYQFENINDDHIWQCKLKQETGGAILSKLRVWGGLRSGTG